MMLALMVRKRLAEVTLEAAEAELRAQRMEAAVRGKGAAEAPKKPHLLHSPAIPNSWVAQAGNFIALVFAAAIASHNFTFIFSFSLRIHLIPCGLCVQTPSPQPIMPPSQAW